MASQDTSQGSALKLNRAESAEAVTESEEITVTENAETMATGEKVTGNAITVENQDTLLVIAASQVHCK